MIGTPFLQPVPDHAGMLSSAVYDVVLHCIVRLTNSIITTARYANSISALVTRLAMPLSPGNTLVTCVAMSSVVLLLPWATSGTEERLEDPFIIRL